MSLGSKCASMMAVLKGRNNTTCEWSCEWSCDWSCEWSCEWSCDCSLECSCDSPELLHDGKAQELLKVVGDAPS